MNPEILQNILVFIRAVLLGYIPQSVGCVLLLYAFNMKKIKWGKFLLVCAIILVVMATARNLPISFGVHTVLTVIAIVLTGIWVLKFHVYKTVIAGIASALFIILSEMLAYWLLNMFASEALHKNLMEGNNYLGFVLGDIASVGYMLIALAIYLFASRRRVKE